MIETRLFVDDAVGETRRVLVDSEARPFRIEIERWAGREHRARVGETWAGRLLEVGPDGDWFVDLGPGGQGVLRTGKLAGLAGGVRLAVQIRGETRGDKGPVVEAAHTGEPVGDRTGRLLEALADAFLVGVEIAETVEGPAARPVVDVALEEAESKSVGLAGGGSIWIEETRALTAIDVDRGISRASPRDLNTQAALEAGRQIAMRGIGGLVVVDFIGAPRKTVAAELADGFLAQVRRLSSCRIDSLGLSRFGLLQATVSRGRQPLSSALDCPADEREALDALREVETIGWSHRGARIGMKLSTPAERWLRSSLPSWEDALGERIGRRWRLTVEDRPVGKPGIRVIE